MSRAWPWYKAYPRDFLDDTIGWPADLKGTYRIVLDLIYMHDGYLVDDPAYIVAYTGLSSKRKWSVIREELIKRGKLQLIDGLLTNHRALIETKNRRKADDKSEINESVSNKNKDLAKREREKDSYKTPNPLKGDDAALGFSKILKGNAKRPPRPKPTKPPKAKIAAQRREVERIKRPIASSALRRAEIAKASTAKGRPPPRIVLCDRGLERYGGGVAKPVEPDKRKLCGTVAADGGFMGPRHAFAAGLEVRGQRILAPPDIRRGVIAERYDDALCGV